MQGGSGHSFPYPCAAPFNSKLWRASNLPNPAGSVSQKTVDKFLLFPSKFPQRMSYSTDSIRCPAAFARRTGSLRLAAPSPIAQPLPLRPSARVSVCRAGSCRPVRGKSPGWAGSDSPASMRSLDRSGSCSSASMRSLDRSGPCSSASMRSLNRSGPCSSASTRSLNRSGPYSSASMRSLDRSGSCSSASTRSLDRSESYSLTKFAPPNGSVPFCLTNTAILRPYSHFRAPMVGYPSELTMF